MTAFLFGGQGAQLPGMGYDFYEADATARHFYDSLPGGEWLCDLSFRADATVLADTANTQPVLVAYQAMVTTLLRQNGMMPEAVCGLSVGEYSALYAAGVLEADAAVTIAQARGRFMRDAQPSCETAMVAVLGMSEEALLEALARHNRDDAVASIANINARTQIVLSGAKSVIDAVTEEVRAAGKRAIPLAVSGPFHTPYMAKAQSDLATVLERIAFAEPQCPVYFNVYGGRTTDADLRSIMVRQMVSPVRLDDCLRAMLADGIRHFVEVAPKAVLAPLLRKLDRSCTVDVIDSYAAWQRFKEGQ